MSPALHLSLAWTDWVGLFAHYVGLAMLSTGGVVGTIPDMHRYLVHEQHWLTDAQFSSSIALAQASPGPNVLFVALMGLNVGMNAGGVWTGLLGVLLTMAGLLIPCTTFAYAGARWGQRNRALRSVRAFKLCMAPIVVALLLSTSWIMTSAHDSWTRDWPVWLLTAATVLVLACARVHFLWLIGVGAALGWAGWL